MLFIKKHVIIIYWNRKEVLRLNSSEAIDCNVLLAIMKEKRFYVLDKEYKILNQNGKTIALKQYTMIYKRENKLCIKK